MGLIYTILPDGRLLIPPVNPQWWSEGDHVTFDKLNYFMGQAGAFLAARPIYQGLGTSSTTTPVGRTSVGFQTDIIDSAGGHNPASNNTQYVIPETGNGQSNVSDYYLCIGYIPYSANDASSVYIAELTGHNNSSSFSVGMQAPGGSSHALTTMVIDVVSVQGYSFNGPYLTLDAYVYGSTNSSTATGTKIPSLSVQWVGGAWVWSPLQAPVTTPHTWVDADEATAGMTGSSSQSGGVKVPLNAEVMENIAFHTAPPVFRSTSYTTGTSPSAASGAWTPVPMPDMTIDNFGGWSSGSNTRYTRKQAGLYFVSGTITWDEPASPAGYRTCQLRVNGDNAQVYGGNSFQSAAGGANTQCGTVVADLIQLNVGDYVELLFYQNQGSSLTLDTGGSSYMIAVWMSL